MRNRKPPISKPSDPHHRIERAKTPHLHQISRNNIGFSMRFDVNFLNDPRKRRKFDLQKIPGSSSSSSFDDDGWMMMMMDDDDDDDG